MPYTDEDWPPPKRTRSMKNIVKKVWAVYSTNDEYGRYDEIDDLKGVYEDKKVAEKAADGQGWYGGQGNVEERTAVKAGGGWWLTQMPFTVKLNEKHVDPRKALRKKALGKLTREERAALELEEED